LLASTRRRLAQGARQVRDDDGAPFRICPC